MERNIIRGGKPSRVSRLVLLGEGRAGRGNATDNGESTSLPTPHPELPLLALLKQSFQGIFARFVYASTKNVRNAREGERFYALTCNIIAIHHYQAPFRERRYAALRSPFPRDALRKLFFSLLLDRLKASNRCFDVHR